MDTSVIVSIFVVEKRTEDITRLIAKSSTVVISDFAAGEFSAAMWTAVRTKRQTEAEAIQALGDFDQWNQNVGERIDVTNADMRLGISHVRRFDLGLLFPDALHLALCARANATLVTGNLRQASAASAIGIATMLL